MNSEIQGEIRRFVCNMFAFPDGYFESKTAEELHISEEARHLLISMQSKRTDGSAAKDAKKKRDEDDLAVFES